MIAGQREADIEEAVATHVPRQSAKKLIEAAVDHFQQAAHCERNVILGWSMEAYRALYRKLLEIGDYHGAMKAVASLQKLASELPPEEDEETERGPMFTTTKRRAKRGSLTPEQARLRKERSNRASPSITCATPPATSAPSRSAKTPPAAPSARPTAPSGSKPICPASSASRGPLTT
jgi:hypothetical protein